MAKDTGFSDAEKSAMRERIKETKANKMDGTAALLAKIEEMPAPDKALATKFHEIVMKTAPELISKTWYGMPAYMNKDGKTIAFFQAASKFGARYATFGFNETAQLDEGNMWPVSYALTKLDDQEVERITTLVKKAVGK
jgi:uncharacterized protein YdhG (YjbR/CyaY superfamily)